MGGQHQVVEEALLKAADGYTLIYGTDFIPEARTAIREGKLAGSTTFSQAAWTRGAIVFALKLAELNQQTKKAGDLPERLTIPVMLAKSENIGEFEGWK